MRAMPRSPCWSERARIMAENKQPFDLALDDHPRRKSFYHAHSRGGGL